MSSFPTSSAKMDSIKERVCMGPTYLLWFLLVSVVGMPCLAKSSKLSVYYYRTAAADQHPLTKTARPTVIAPEVSGRD